MNAIDRIIAGIDVAALREALQAGWRIALILILAWVAMLLSGMLRRRFLRHLAGRQDGREQVKRLVTLTRVFGYLVTVAVTLVAGMLVLAQLGISIAPILGAAGVVGVAVGFGAQSLVKDYFSGLFLILEDQVHEGDIIEAAGKSGKVEEVTLRHIRLRDYEGNVHFVPNGLVTTVTNRSRGYAYAVIDVGIAYRGDIDRALGLMREVGRDMRAAQDFGPRILDDIEVAGVEQWVGAAVTLRCRIKVAPLEQWDVRREFLRRLKRAFDEAGIEIT